jgi:hypothetical protein
MPNPSVPAYCNEKIGAVKLLTVRNLPSCRFCSLRLSQDLMTTNGVSWGFTDNMKNDHHQMKAVKDEAGGALTTRRNGIKNMVCDIPTVC